MEGLEGVTIGRLAGDLGMSKSGVLGHFGTKEALQLATVKDVIDQFRRRVVDPVMQETAPGLRRVLALCDYWLDYLTATGLPGGCLLTAAATEFDGRRGEVRNLIAAAWAQWRSLLVDELQLAVDTADLSQEFEIEQAVFELVAVGPALNQALQLHGDPSSTERARRAVRRILEQRPT